MPRDPELVPFICPEHGKVVETRPNALVECRCGRDAAPEGVSPLEHRKRWLDRRRQDRARRKRDKATL